MHTKTIPGTNIEYSRSEDAFSVFRPMLQMTGGLSLSQLCKITGLQSSTIQNWVKRGFVPRPEKKKYFERHLSRILLISALRDCMNIDQIGELMVMINGDTDDVSDDIVSESKLYDYFCKSIKRLDDVNLDEEKISRIVSEVVDGSDILHRERIICALRVMVYAYISGICLRQIEADLNKLKGGLDI